MESSSILFSSRPWDLFSLRLELLCTMQYWSDKSHQACSICISWRNWGGRIRGNEVTRLFVLQLISRRFSSRPCHLLAANENEDSAALWAPLCKCMRSAASCTDVQDASISWRLQPDKEEKRIACACVLLSSHFGQQMGLIWLKWLEGPLGLMILL